MRLVAARAGATPREDVIEPRSRSWSHEDRRSAVDALIDAGALEETDGGIETTRDPPRRITGDVVAPRWPDNSEQLMEFVTRGDDDA